MKKFLATLMMMAMMAIVLPFATATEANAQTRYVRNGRTYYTTTYKKPSFYRRHRNMINMGIGTGAGAILDALIGGNKGATIYALSGLGVSSLYSYKIK